MKRFVEVKQVIKLTPELWVADFITKTSSRLLPDEDVIKWRAYLRIVYLEFDKYENLEKTEEEKLNYTSNPFGFKVVKYSLAYAGKPQKAESAMQTAKKVFENLEDVVKWWLSLKNRYYIFHYVELVVFIIVVRGKFIL